MKWLIFVGIIVLYYIIKGIFFAKGLKNEKNIMQELEKETKDSSFMFSVLTDLNNSLDKYYEINKIAISTKAKLVVFICAKLHISNWSFEDSIYMAILFDDMKELISFLIINKIERKKTSEETIGEIMGTQGKLISREDILSLLKLKKHSSSKDESNYKQIKTELAKHNLDSEEKITKIYFEVTSPLSPNFNLYNNLFK